MHRKTDMLEILTTLALHYPQARYTNDELSALAADVRRRERYFPGVAAMIDYASAVAARRRAAVRELPPPPLTPEKMSRGALLASLIRRRLDGDAEAGREFDRLIGRTRAVS